MDRDDSPPASITIWQLVYNCGRAVASRAGCWGLRRHALALWQRCEVWYLPSHPRHSQLISGAPGFIVYAEKAERGEGTPDTNLLIDSRSRPRALDHRLPFQTVATDGRA
ncbi:hypothetical protein BDA96_09G171900 [Sorghum bicolor]|jgi:hypothetical protein|uniref:Uncharacterized protein n=2 Tax=Sorghum bicolor TaxID=4558 RepID=A0A921U4F0_SORBI|nr:hypothetical protein BDA96_09G171900 [Sorghum bicolor]KXG22157.1 hypothetical protein SORBI_3009G163000 [Sorghum bicolor]